jgi:dTDP-4-dehydrorhamnose reductase
MTLSPIDINIVVLKIDDLVRKRINGIYHCSCDVDISYYDYAVNFAQQYGFSKDLVLKDSYKNKNFPFATPKFTSLSPS